MHNEHNLYKEERDHEDFRGVTLSTHRSHAHEKEFSVAKSLSTNVYVRIGFQDQMQR